MKSGMRILAALCILCLAFLLLIRTPDSVGAEAKEKQLTFTPINHSLDNNENFSKDDKFLVYDTRETYGPGINNSTSIEKVNVLTGKESVVYAPQAKIDVTNAAAAPGLGAASFSPVADEVVFIHGPLVSETATVGYYGKTNRRAGVVAGDGSGTLHFLDARDVFSETTPAGAHRGGSHRHEFTLDGKRVGFTYDDHLLTKYPRTIGMMVPNANAPAGATHYCVLLVATVPSGTGAAGELEEASSDAWIGSKGLMRGFIGKVREQNGSLTSSLFVVDIPENIDVTTASSGSKTTMMTPPKGLTIRRLTMTKAGGIVRGSHDGTRIAYYAQAADGTNQVFIINSKGSDSNPDPTMRPMQATFLTKGVTGGVRWHPSGNSIAVLSDNGVAVTCVKPGPLFGVSYYVSPHGLGFVSTDALVWSHDGKTLAYNRRVPTYDSAGTYVKDYNKNDFRQIFLADFPDADNNGIADPIETGQVDFIRPGLNLSILKYTVPGDTRKPIVQFQITDDKGQPLDRDGVLTPGSVATSWVLARIKPEEKQYTAYTTRASQPSTDSGGFYTQVESGIYQYTFGTALPADFPKNATHTLGVYATRDLTAWGLKRHVANLTYSYVPDGSKVITVRDVVRNETCNSCHNPLQAHGGARRDVLLCNLCHYPGAVDTDTGNSIDMKVMVHKIHRGRELPSVKAGVPYKIVGYNQTVYDYSEVGFPQDIRNCDTCHDKAIQAENWFKAPNRQACGSCHDDVNFETGAGHSDYPMTTDQYCFVCHPEGGVKEFDQSVKGAHVIPAKSTQLVNPKIEIVRIYNAEPGERTEIVFRITDKDGNRIPVEKMTRLYAHIAGPTKDFNRTIRERLDVNNCVPDAFTGTNAYLFEEPLRSSWKGTYSFGMSGYIDTVINAGTAKQQTVADATPVVSRLVAITGNEIVPRRQVISEAKCNACHDKLAQHRGGIWNSAAYCVTCHTPRATGEANARQKAPSLNMSYMTHKIHAGKNLIRGYEVGSSDFSKIGFPGDLRDCTQCHLPGTYQIPLSRDIRATITQQDFFSPTPPESTACLSCHDGKESASHAWTNISEIGEACSTCHGSGKDKSIDTVHAH